MNEAPTSRRWLVAATAIAVILFFSVTMRTLLDEPNGFQLALYGFPLGWHFKDLATSLTHDIDAVAFTVDASVYLALAIAALAPFRARLSDLLAQRRWIGRVLVTLATLPVLLFALGLWIGEERFAELGPGWNVRRREISIGWSAVFADEPNDLHE